MLRTSSRRILLHPLWVPMLGCLLLHHALWASHTRGGGTWPWHLSYLQHLEMTASWIATGRWLPGRGARRTNPGNFVVLYVVRDASGVIEVASDLDATHPLFTSRFSGFTELGSAIVDGKRVDSGVYVATERRDVVTVRYTPTKSGALANPPAAFGELLDAIERETHAMTALPTIELDRSGITPSGPGAPHDFGNAWTHTHAIGRQRYWGGYAHNVAAAAGWAWFVLAASRFVRTRGWRDWNRKAWECRKCRYDRRNTSDGEPCPECGTEHLL